MNIPAAPKEIRHAVRRGMIAGYRGTVASWREAAKLGHWFRLGWLEGKRLRGLTPYGMRCRIVETT